MNKQEKQEQVQYITDKFKNAKSVIFANYRGLNVAEVTELRQNLSRAESTMKVVKNRLAKRAVKEMSVEGLNEHFIGPTAMAASEVDPVMPAKVLVNFAKDHKVLEIKVGYMDGQVMDLATITTLANLPSREELLSKALSSMQAPATNFTMALAAIPRGLVNVINAIKDTKQ